MSNAEIAGNEERWPQPNIGDLRVPEKIRLESGKDYIFEMPRGTFHVSVEDDDPYFGIDVEFQPKDLSAYDRKEEDVAYTLPRCLFEIDESSACLAPIARVWAEPQNEDYSDKICCRHPEPGPRSKISAVLIELEKSEYENMTQIVRSSLISDIFSSGSEYIIDLNEKEIPGRGTILKGWVSDIFAKENLEDDPYRLCEYAANVISGKIPRNPDNIYPFAGGYIRIKRKGDP